MKLALKIVSIVGLVLWTACCFMGLYYASDGNLLVAIPVTLLIGVALFLSYLLMLKMQDKSATQGNRKRAKTTGFIMLGMYVVASLVSAYYINHFVKTFDIKQTIQDEAKLAVDELRMTFDTEQLDPMPNSYRQWVQGKSDDYKRMLTNNGFEGTIKDEVISLEDVLLGTEDKGYINLENIVVDDLERISWSIERWNFQTVLKRLHDLQQKSQWEDQVVEFSKAHEYTQDEPFVPVREHKSPEKDQLINPSLNFSMVAIIIMLALQVIILLGYLLSLKTGGKNDKIVTSDTGSTRSWSSNN